jgi:elongation factor Ts
MAANEIKELRERTGAGILDCKKALAENGDNIEKSIEWLRAKGTVSAAKKAGRTASEGLVHAYIHAGGKIGVLVEVNCETDFVAINDGFKDLVNDIALHIAASAPEYLDRESVPADAIARERAVQIAKTMEEGKPQAVAERIVEGRMGKYYETVCLMEQKFVKDDSKTIKDLVSTAVAKIGENIKIRRFSRFVLGEGLEKRSGDFAAEVAAQAGVAAS